MNKQTAIMVAAKRGIGIYRNGSDWGTAPRSKLNQMKSKETIYPEEVKRLRIASK